MATTFQLYADPALTSKVRSDLMFLQTVSAPDPVDLVVYFGSSAIGHVARANSSPGIDPVQISVMSAGAGIPASCVFLASSPGGLDTAIGGAPLDLGLSVSSGLENAVPIYIRLLDTAHIAGLFGNLSISVSEIEETS